MTAAENVCYTLINVTSDSEPPSEVSLKTDLGKYFIYLFYLSHRQSCFYNLSRKDIDTVIQRKV